MKKKLKKVDLRERELREDEEENPKKMKKKRLEMSKFWKVLYDCYGEEWKRKGERRKEREKRNVCEKLKWNDEFGQVVRERI